MVIANGPGNDGNEGKPQEQGLGGGYEGGGGKENGGGGDGR